MLPYVPHHRAQLHVAHAMFPRELCDMIGPMIASCVLREWARHDPLSTALKRTDSICIIQRGHLIFQRFSHRKSDDMAQCMLDDVILALEDASAMGGIDGRYGVWLRRMQSSVLAAIANAIMHQSTRCIE